MKFLTRTAPAPLTLDERAAAAQATASAALSAFQAAADDLAAAATEFVSIVEDAEEEIERLSIIASNAYADAEAKRERAARLRDLIGGLL